MHFYAKSKHHKEVSNLYQAYSKWESIGVLANDWLDKNPFANYKSKVKEVERVYLSEEEIQNTINKDFKNGYHTRMAKGVA